MRVYRVIIERDGETVREPRKITTKLLREEWRYAALSMNAVWDEVQTYLLSHPEDTLLAIQEEAPVITTLSTAETL